MPAPTTNDDLPTRLASALRGTYHVERELGGGGMARVFLAREIALDRQVVIKLLPTDMGSHLSLARFEREIALAARLQHAHIVPLLSAGQADGIPYYTMPFVDGESLRARFDRGDPVPLQAAVRELREIASALAYAHAHGIIHRDIKPENVLLSSGAAMVTDFGVAKAVSEATGAITGLTSIGTAIGTPAYMAPEQISADPLVDHRADLYAWGVLGYELLAGRSPFAGRPLQSILAAHLTEVPQSIGERRGDVPTELVQLVMRCLEKDPAKRPQSATDILAVLDTVSLSGSRNATAWTRPSTMSRRLSRGWIVGAALILAVAGGWLVRRSARHSASGAGTPRSVAVLPFDNVGGDSTQEYFSAGMTDDIASALVNDGVKVAPRASALAFKGKHPTAREVGSVLGVDAMVTGRVSRLGERLRVAVELADTRAGVVLGSFSLDRNTRDLFAVQRAITDSILGTLRVRLQPRQAGAPRTIDEDPAAHELVMQGRYLSDLGTRDGITKAIALFKRALEIDPRAVSAYVGLAYAANILCDGYLPPIESYPNGKHALEQAMLLDSSRADVWSNLAMTTAYEWDWPKMRRELDRSRALNPNHIDLLFGESTYQLLQGNYDEAAAVSMRAKAIDPLDVVHDLMLQFALLFGRHYDSVIAVARHIESLQPGFSYLDSFAGYAFGFQHRFAEAESAFKAAEPSLGHRSPGEAWVLALDGKKDAARAILVEIERDWKTKYVVPEMIAWAYDALGDTERTYAWLERGIEVHSWWAPLSVGWPGFEARREEARFKAIRRRVARATS